MSITFNPNTSDFIVATLDKERAERVGLTLSTKVKGSQGQPIYFTKDPYAALEFQDEADNAVKQKLAHLIGDYAASWATDSVNTYEVGKNAPAPLRPYQNAGIDYCLTKEHALIGDEPGLGKSSQAIAIGNHIDAGRTLIICPARIRRQWRDQIRLWSTIPNVRACPIERASDGVASWPHYTIISYELTRNKDIHAALRAIKWDHLIVDEAHAVKTTTSQRSRAIFGGGRSEELSAALSDSVKRITALTGTFLPNRPREAYVLARALAWDSIDWLSFEDFRYRFNPSARIEIKTKDPLTGIPTTRIVNKEDRGRLPELQNRLRCNFMVRRLKADVLKDLPDKQYELSYIDPEGAIADIIRRERMLDFNVEDLKRPFDAKMWGMISTLRKEMGQAKIPQAIAHMKYLLDVVGLEKVVMFSHHHVVMDAMREALSEYGVVEVRGGMSPRQSADSVLAFRTNPKLKVFSGQLDAAGFGIDGLQEVAFHVVFIEPAWVPGTNEQAIDRLHRFGQHANVVAQFLVVEGSLDERMLATVIDKTHTIHAALDDKRGQPV